MQPDKSPPVEEESADCYGINHSQYILIGSYLGVSVFEGAASAQVRACKPLVTNMITTLIDAVAWSHSGVSVRLLNSYVCYSFLLSVWFPVCKLLLLLPLLTGYCYTGAATAA
jgi:hypothetical protein